MIDFELAVFEVDLDLADFEEIKFLLRGLILPSPTKQLGDVGYKEKLDKCMISLSLSIKEHNQMGAQKELYVYEVDDAPKEANQQVQLKFGKILEPLLKQKFFLWMIVLMQLLIQNLFSMC